MVAEGATPAPAEVHSIEPAIASRRAVADAAKESFLSRHRKPILLAAAVVAIAFLTLNLVSQRLRPSNADADSACDGSDRCAATQPGRHQAASRRSGHPYADGAGARHPDGRFARDRVDRPRRHAGLPVRRRSRCRAPLHADTELASSRQPRPATSRRLSRWRRCTASPVKVELPPESVGPLELRAGRRQWRCAGAVRDRRDLYRRPRRPAGLQGGRDLVRARRGAGLCPGAVPARQPLRERPRASTRTSSRPSSGTSAPPKPATACRCTISRRSMPAANWASRSSTPPPSGSSRPPTAGMTDSQFNLGMLYARGLGVTQSLEALLQVVRARRAERRQGRRQGARRHRPLARCRGGAAGSTPKSPASTPAPIDLAANFAPIGTWTKTFDPGETINDARRRHERPEGADKLGYDVGTPDGIAGPKTADAIKAFERATGMSEIGADQSAAARGAGQPAGLKGDARIVVATVATMLIKSDHLQFGAITGCRSFWRRICRPAIR